MIRGSALVTTVLESIATNIASSRPLSASMISRWLIGPDCSASTTGGTGVPGSGLEVDGVTTCDTGARFMTTRRLTSATIFPTG